MGFCPICHLLDPKPAEYCSKLGFENVCKSNSLKYMTELLSTEVWNSGRQLYFNFRTCRCYILFIAKSHSHPGIPRPTPDYWHLILHLLSKCLSRLNTVHKKSPCSASLLTVIAAKQTTINMCMAITFHSRISIWNMLVQQHFSPLSCLPTNTAQLFHNGR